MVSFEKKMATPTGKVRLVQAIEHTCLFFIPLHTSLIILQWHVKKLQFDDRYVLYTRHLDTLTLHRCKNTVAHPEAERFALSSCRMCLFFSYIAMHVSHYVPLGFIWFMSSNH